MLLRTLAALVVGALSVESGIFNDKPDLNSATSGQAALAAHDGGLSTAPGIGAQPHTGVAAAADAIPSVAHWGYTATVTVTTSRREGGGTETGGTITFFGDAAASDVLPLDPTTSVVPGSASAIFEEGSTKVRTRGCCRRRTPHASLAPAPCSL